MAEVGRKVRIGGLSKTVGLHPNWLRKLADEGVIPSEKSEKGQRLFDIEMVQVALNVRARQKQSTQAGAGLEVLHGRAQWGKNFQLAGLEEDKVWNQIATELKLDRRSNIANTISYAITAMINNAVDHSRGTSATIRFWANETFWAFEIEDDGRGVFSNLMEGLGLEDRFNSLRMESDGQ